MSSTARREGARTGPSVVVAGHLCLDLIPALAAPGRAALSGGAAAAATADAPVVEPGALAPIGPLGLAVGGCVGNTGIALHRLGLTTTLVARVGDDRLGPILAGLVGERVPAGSARLVTVAGPPTSYSLVFNRPGADREISHFPGVNDTFVAADVPAELLATASLLHVGYPPLMAALVADDGRELIALLDGARSAGALTSLDMANANLEGASVNWTRLLERALPRTDVFLPSLAEAAHLLGASPPTAESADDELLATAAELATALLAGGVAVAGVKLGDRGLYVRTAGPARLARLPIALDPAWADRELHSTVFETAVVGTAGAGDATIAGFLFGLLHRMTPEAAVSAACAVGGASTEAADGTSAIPAWSAIEARLRARWRRVTTPLPGGWAATDDPGLRLGPNDRRRRAAASD